MADFTDTTEQAAPQTGDYIIGYRGSTDSRWLWETWLDNFDTDDLAEGVGALYWTAERTDDRVDALLVAGTGINKSYNDGAGTLTLSVDATTAEIVELSPYFFAKRAHVIIPHAEILTLNATPKAINIVIPGSDVYVILGAIARADLTTAGYTNLGVDIIDTNNSNILWKFPSTLLSPTSDTASLGHPSTNTGVIIREGTGISVKANTSDPTGGNAANLLKVCVFYQTVDFSTLV